VANQLHVREGMELISDYTHGGDAERGGCRREEKKVTITRLEGSYSFELPAVEEEGAKARRWRVKCRVRGCLK